MSAFRSFSTAVVGLMLVATVGVFTFAKPEPPGFGHSGDVDTIAALNTRRPSCRFRMMSRPFMGFLSVRRLSRCGRIPAPPAFGLQRCC